MTADTCSTVDKGLSCRIQVPNIASLHDQDDDPVDARDDGIEGEWGRHVLVLAPYCVATMIMFAVRRGIEGVVNRCDNNKKP